MSCTSRLFVLVLGAGSPFAAQEIGPGGSPAPRWIASAGSHLERMEHHFQPVTGEPGVWSAPNRRHELRGRVSASGLEVFPRTASASGAGAEWTLTLRTSAFGRGEVVHALAPADLKVAAERTELDHGPLVEWLVNGSEGIEQGWTIGTRPMGAGELWIGLELAGTLRLRIEDGARSSVLVDERGDVVLRYRDLHAFDAAGRELPARLRATERGFGIAIDDAGASYPLSVDPLLTGPVWTTEGDQVGAFFGNSLASAGDVNGDGFGDVVVGAFQYDNGQLDEGRAFLYLGSSAGLSTSPAWTAEADQPSASFGACVARAGDVNGDGFDDVIVGAHSASNGQTCEGQAFLYLGSAAGLSTSPSWSAESNQADAHFGQQVAGAGDVNADGYDDVLVGSFVYDSPHADEGKVFLYLGSAAGLATSASWTAEGDQAQAWFGISLASAGDVNGDGYGDVLVGAGAFDGGQVDEGRAYLYLGSSGGLSSNAAWTAEGDQPGARFGSAVASAGDANGDGFADVLVGAYSFAAGETNEGRAFFYAGSTSGLATSPSWIAESNQVSALFGASVASAGDVNGDGYSDVLVGAFAYSAGSSAEGRAFLHLGSASGPSPTASWTAESNQDGAHFGIAVACGGDVNGDGHSDVLVGASQYDNGQVDEGRAFLYAGAPDGLATVALWTTEGDQAFSAHGETVASAGDVNGDGYGDVLVAAPFFDNGQSTEGRVLLFLGSAGGPPLAPAWTFEGDQAVAEFGCSVASAGDVNGDGYGDIVIGARGISNPGAQEGRAYVFLGSPAGLSPLPAWTAESNRVGSSFGNSVASAGDVNGDGYGDVIVGAPWFSGGEQFEGRAYVYLGSATGLATGAAWAVESNRASSEFGGSVAGVGDVNADGFGDVVVGEPQHSAGALNFRGRAQLFLGSPAGLSTVPAWSALGDQEEARFGTCVARAGDVNGDGYADWLVGAWGKGHAYLYAGSASGFSTSYAWLMNGLSGHTVAGAGDVDGDGYADVLASTIGDTGVRLYLGSATWPALSPAWTAPSDRQSSDWGTPFASAGDVNGDGYGDVIVGLSTYTGDLSEEGRASVYLGNGGSGGLVKTLQQRTRSAARPIAVVGSTGENGLFRIRCEFPRTAGFSWASSASPEAWLEWEVKPLGVPFDGTGLRRGAAQSLVPSGGSLSFDELASVDDAAGHARTSEARSYHWRARVATNQPLFPNTAWFSLPGSSPGEAKVRKPARTP